jgi:signal transduction histidine kinase
VSRRLLVRAAGFVLDWLPRQVARVPATVQTKLLVAFLGSAALLVGLGAVGLRAVEDANARAAELVRLESRIAAYRQLQQNATSQLYSIAAAFLVSDMEELDALERRIDLFAYDFDRAEFVADADRDRLVRVEADYTALLGTAKQILRYIRAGNPEQARWLHRNQANALAVHLERQLHGLVTTAEADMVASLDRSRAAYRTSLAVMIAASLGSTLLALALGYTISASLIAPVRAIRARLRAIAEGEFEGDLAVPNRDELGDLAENVTRMSRKLERLYGELAAANRHKSAFLANMSHELRTPMNAIIGFNRLVMRRCKDILPEKQYENLGKIAISAEHLLTLINSVLDLSKIEAGRMEVHKAPFPLGQLVESCARTTEPLLDGKPVRLVAALAPDLPVIVGDQDKLRQILLNLLGNAAKFTERGTITLTARVEAGQVAVAVADTGPGIPADALGRIFEEFAQLDASATRRHGGTGLGLAIARRLAGLLGGKIAVESAPGQGSTFSLSFPCEPAAAVRADGNPVSDKASAA